MNNEKTTQDKKIFYSIDEIINIWSDCYGENMKTEYKGFIKILRNLRNKKKVLK